MSILLMLGLNTSHAEAQRDLLDTGPGNGVAGQSVQEKATASHKEPPSDQRGTEKIPLVIKISPTKKNPQQDEEDKKERDMKTALDLNLTAYTGWQAIFTLILVFVGGLQLVLFIWQLRMVRESLTDTKKAADAANVGAASTRDSADTAKLSMVASQRAYVHFGGCRWISHPDTNDGHIFWRIHLRWNNGGSTPTRGLTVYVHWELRENRLPQHYPFDPGKTVKLGQATIAPGGFIQVGGWDINGTDLLTISAGGKYLYIWGRAEYRDVFPETPLHITKFCVFATNLTGDPLKPWHAETNPFDITFAVYHHHNCEDEDCNQDS